MAVHVTVECVGLCAQFHAGHVFHAQHVAVLLGTEHDVLKLRDVGQTTFVLHRELECVRRVFTQRTGRRFQVLFAQCVGDVRWYQTVLCHHVGLQPDTQAVGVTHGHHVAHAFDTLDLRHDVDVKVVGQENLVVAVVRAIKRTDLQETRLTLVRGHTDSRHLGRQQTLCAAHAVLHVHGRHVGVGALGEIYLDAGRTRVGGSGFHVGHVLHTVDVFLQRLHHALHHGIRAGTRIGGRHVHGRGGNVRVLLDRQGAQ